MKLLRPNFDAACASVGLLPELANALWSCLVPEHAQTGAGRKRWTATAAAMIEPLQRELTTVNRQRATLMFSDINVEAPDGSTTHLGEMHLFYLERLNDIQLRMSRALREGDHLCTPDRDTLAQPMRVITTNERAAGRPAGNYDWTQWEDQAVVRRLQRIFNARPQARGGRWEPYQPYGSRRRGAAENNNAMKVWRGAFHDAVQPYQPITADPHLPFTQPIWDFNASLKSLAVQQHIDDAIREQVRAHRSPLNRAFQHPHSIWHALATPVRIELAAQLHEAYVATHEAMLAAGHPDAAPYDPAVSNNPFELTEEERNPG